MTCLRVLFFFVSIFPSSAQREVGHSSLLESRTNAEARTNTRSSPRTSPTQSARRRSHNPRDVHRRLIAEDLAVVQWGALSEVLAKFAPERRPAPCPSAACREFVAQCMAQSPSARPTAAALLQGHAFVGFPRALRSPSTLLRALKALRRWCGRGWR